MEEPKGLNMDMQRIEELNSDTSEDEEIEQIMKNVKNPKKQPMDADMDAESVAFSTSTYRTKNEIDQNDLQSIIQFMPKMVDKEIGTINVLGKVENFIPPHTLFVRKDEDSKDILDLDNFICNDKKELLGYIDEVVGPVSDPYYTIVFYPAFLESAEKQEIDLEATFKGKTLYFVEKTKKLIFWNNLLNQKGCDASNFYDEEINVNSDKEFSDDEQEKAYKKIINKVKNQRKRKRKEAAHPSYSPHIPSMPQHFSKKRDQKHHAVNSYQPTIPYPYGPPAAYPSYAPGQLPPSNSGMSSQYSAPAPYPYQYQPGPPHYDPNFPPQHK